MAEQSWVRRDRETGSTSITTEAEVRKKVKGVYIDVDLAIKHASKRNPLTTGFADYYPQST